MSEEEIKFFEDWSFSYLAYFFVVVMNFAVVMQ